MRIIASDFRVSLSTISLIKNRKIWGHESPLARAVIAVGVR